MRITTIILSTFVASGYIIPSNADVVPKRSHNYNGNYQTLLKDQKVSPLIADCIATGYDLVKTAKNYDRLGFTKADIAAAKTNNNPSGFSMKNSAQSSKAKVSKVISIPGEARLHKVGYKWDNIILRCGINKGKITAIELAPGSGS